MIYEEAVSRNKNISSQFMSHGRPALSPFLPAFSRRLVSAVNDPQIGSDVPPLPGKWGECFPPSVFPTRHIPGPSTDDLSPQISPSSRSRIPIELPVMIFSLLYAISEQSSSGCVGGLPGVSSSPHRVALAWISPGFNQSCTHLPLGNTNFCMRIAIANVAVLDLIFGPDRCASCN